MKVKALAAACLLAFSLSAPLHAADDRVTLNFVNSDLESTLKAVTLITGKSFVIDPKLKGTVNIVSNQPVDRAHVLPIVQSALRQQGVALVDNGTVVKVVPEAEARQHGSPVLAGGPEVRGSGDRFMTQVYPLRYESASQLAQTLRPLLGNNSVIAAYQAGNTLILSDYAENLARINRIIEHMDQPRSGDLKAFPVRNISVVDAAQTLARLMPEVVLQGTAALTPVPEGVKRVLVVPDTRSAQILVRADQPSQLEQVRNILNMLDQPSANGSSMHVIYLRNAEATRLAGTLRGIMTGQDSGTTGSSSLSGGGSSTTSSSSGGGTAASSATQSTQNTGNTASKFEVAGATVLLQADPVTNSLIVTAPDHVYNDIRSMVEKLDVRRAQIYIEAMIVELNVSKGGEAGFQWGAFGKTQGGVFGGVLGSLSTSSSNNLSTLATSYLASQSSSTTTATIPSGFNVAIGAGSFGALMTALQTSSDANVLSTPNLQMLDNEEARIVIGQNIPIKTGTTINSSSTYSSVERKDIGIKLKIKPQISEGGAITLTVAQEVSSIDSTVDTSDQGIATKVRSIETKVLVDDGQLVVLGGLIEDRINNAENRVPLLADLPLIGNMFRYRSRSHSKVNLMVFLHPRVLRDAISNQTMANERYDFVRRAQAAYDPEHSTVLPDLPNVQLPQLAPGEKPAENAAPAPAVVPAAAPAAAAPAEAAKAP